MYNISWSDELTYMRLIERVGDDREYYASTQHSLRNMEIIHQRLIFQLTLNKNVVLIVKQKGWYIYVFVTSRTCQKYGYI